MEAPFDLDRFSHLLQLQWFIVKSFALREIYQKIHCRLICYVVFSIRMFDAWQFKRSVALLVDSIIIIIIIFYTIVET